MGFSSILRAAKGSWFAAAQEHGRGITVSPDRSTFSQGAASEVKLVALSASLIIVVFGRRHQANALKQAGRHARGDRSDQLNRYVRPWSYAIWKFPMINKINMPLFIIMFLLSSRVDSRVYFI